MKHPLVTTLLLLFLFVAAQIIGLSLVNISITGETTTPAGEQELTYATTAIGERPDFRGYQSFLFLLIGVFVGTLLLLFLIRLKKVRIWQLWFFLAVFLSTAVAFGVVVDHLVAILLGALLAYLKVYRPNPIVHNITEIFMYGGIAVILVPLFDLVWIALVLVVISIYDVIAVNKTRHMVEMAKFQTEQRLFAGLMVPRGGAVQGRPSKRTKRAKRATGGTAILGGGDIAFPLLFSGVVMEYLILRGVSQFGALLNVFVITVTTTLALGLLFFLARNDRFYPAMPIVSLGCFLGYGIILLL